jgi:methylenetetrahydrofolate reductase (NADPH)
MPLPSISFEFYPPKTDEQRAQLDKTAAKLKSQKPHYVSCTFGAGGSTLSYTPETIERLHAHHGLDAAPHLSCVGGTRAELGELLLRYKAMGCRRIVALRGDLPSGMGQSGDFRYASDLVEFIRTEYDGFFHIEVAAYPEWHPQAKSPKDDLLAFKRKADAGADSAITQYFYNFDAYLHFVDQVQAMGIDIPIVPGIMPIASFSKLARFSDACGAEIPRWMRRKFEAYGDDTASIRAFGLDVVTGLCERLLAAGAPGLHFYSMNQAGLTTAICERLKLG